MSDAPGRARTWAAGTPRWRLAAALGRFLLRAQYAARCAGPPSMTAQAACLLWVCGHNPKGPLAPATHRCRRLRQWFQGAMRQIQEGQVPQGVHLLCGAHGGPHLRSGQLPHRVAEQLRRPGAHRDHHEALQGARRARRAAHAHVAARGRAGGACRALGCPRGRDLLGSDALA